MVIGDRVVSGGVGIDRIAVSPDDRASTSRTSVLRGSHQCDVSFPSAEHAQRAVRTVGHTPLRVVATRVETTTTPDRPRAATAAHG